MMVILIKQHISKEAQFMKKLKLSWKNWGWVEKKTSLIKKPPVFRHIKIKKPEVRFIITNIFDRKSIKTPFLHSFPAKNLLYDKMELRLFYFRMTIRSSFLLYS